MTVLPFLRSHTFRALTVFVALGLAGCGDSEPALEPTTISVTPGSATLAAVGDTRSFSATVLDQNGDPLAGAAVSWQSSASAVASVDASGTVTAVSNGTATIRAVSGTASGSASVTVDQEPAGTELAGGDTQTGAAGDAVSEPVGVRVLDSRGNGAEGIVVQFTVTAGGGSVSPASVPTNSQGLAETTWTLGEVAGTENVLEARLASGAGGVLTFRATSVAGPASEVVVEAGAGQSAVRGTTLPQAIQVQITDRVGNAIAGADVAFTVASGGGSVDPGSTQADSQGRTSTTWTLGSEVGEQSIQVSSGDATGTITAMSTVVPTDVGVAAGQTQTGSAGAAVATPPSVLVTDAQSLPAPGVAVVFTVRSGNGTVTAPSAVPGSKGALADGDAVTVTTGTDGIAAVGAWTLGTGVGANTLEAAVSGLTPVTFTATASAGPAAALAKVSGDEQSGPTGTALPQALVVQVDDQFGNPVAGAAVTFAVATGDGSLSATSVTTGVDGRAQTIWTLGGVQGAQSVTADAAGQQVTFTGTGTATPANMAAQAGQDQTATVNTDVTTPPAVLVTTSNDLPVPGVSVTFTVTTGGGQVTADGTTATSVVVQTNDQGIAAVSGWTLGSTAGTGSNVLTASANGVSNVVFTASTTAGAPTTFAKVSGDAQTGTVSAALGAPVVVRVTDQFNNPIAGATVAFAVAEGSVGAASVNTDANGQAQTTWTLGATVGAQQLTASTNGLPDLIFNATGQAGGGGGAPSCSFGAIQTGFQIDLCFEVAVDAAVRNVFIQAAQRWQQIITGDLPDRPGFSVVQNDQFCNNTVGVSGDLDDLVIFVTVEAIDGPNGILGSAGPCQIRGGVSHPTAGRMRFDEADVQSLLNGGDLQGTILHEMGHVLGIGTLWNFGSFNFLQNPTNGTANAALDTHFNGPLAIAAFDQVGGSGRTVDSKVPVENTQGGEGTLDGHWRESTMVTELMTGFLDSGQPNPLSLVTIQSLADMQYVVDIGQAETYTVANPNGAPGAEDRPRIHLKGDIMQGPIAVLDEEGNVIRVIRR